MGFNDLVDLLVLPPLMPNRVKRQILNENEIFVYDLSFPFSETDTALKTLSCEKDMVYSSMDFFYRSLQPC